MKIRICYRVLLAMRAAMCVSASSNKSPLAGSLPRPLSLAESIAWCSSDTRCRGDRHRRSHAPVAVHQTDGSPAECIAFCKPVRTFGVGTRRSTISFTEAAEAPCVSRCSGQRRRARGNPPLAMWRSTAEPWGGASHVHEGANWMRRGQLLRPQGTGSRPMMMMMLAQPRKKLPERSVDVCCMKCKAKLYKYKKGGKGSLVKCYQERIVEDLTGGSLECPGCGQEFARPTMIHGKPAFKMIGGKVFQKK